MRDRPSLQFADLIAPLTPEEFFRDVWEQRPLVQRCQAGDSFVDLLSWETADQLIYGAALQHRSVRLFRDGAWLPEASYAAAPTPSALADRLSITLADPVQVFEQFRRGASIHVRDLHRSHPPIARFCCHLEEVLGFPVGATAFLSPPNVDPQRGEPKFVVHYDEADQWILQVSGTKRWRIYDAPFPLPLGDQSSEEMGVVPGECSHELTLRAGEVIYLPRGYLHEAVTTDQPSLHLSLFVNCYRWLEVLRGAIDSLRTDVRLRRSIPVGTATGQGRAEFEAQFEQIKRLALDELRADAAIARLRRSFLKGHQPVMDGHLRDWMRLDQIQADSVVRRRPGFFSEISDGGKATPRFGNRAIREAAFDPESLRFITSHTLFRVAEIPGPPDDDGRVALAKRLVRAGLLELAIGADDE